MAITKAQAKAFLTGMTDAQLDKLGELLDAVSPKFESDGVTPRANTLDDLSDHVRGHYTALYKSWKKSQEPDPAF